MKNFTNEFMLELKLYALIFEFIGKRLVKIVNQLTPVWSAVLNAFVKQVPLEINESRFGVTEDLFCPKVLSALSESIVIKKIFGFNLAKNLYLII